MKRTLTLVCAVILLRHTIHAQTTYSFPSNMWKIEKASFPLSFAPTINYKGTDEIRFMPNFENAQANTYFSYCFVWYLDGDVKFTPEQLTDDFKKYYDGLCHLTDGTTVTEKKATAAAKYQQAFSYVIQTTDNLYTHLGVTLNGGVNIAKCNGGKNTIVFFEISPKATGDEVWKELDAVRDGMTWVK